MPKVILKTLFPKQKIYFTGQINFYDEKQVGQVVRTVIVTQDLEAYEGQPKADKPAWRIRFDENKVSHFIEWEEDETGKGKTAIDRKKKDAAFYLSKHEKVKNFYGDANTNLRGEPMFALEWEGMKNTFLADQDEKKFEVYQKMRTLTPEEKRDCLYYYGQNATGLKHSELIHRLGNFENGVLQNTKVKEGEQLSTADHFLTFYGKEGIKDVKMLTEKCLVYDLIKKDGKGYWYNQEFIGGSITNIYDYLNSNTSIKESLKKDVSKKDSPVVDDMKEEKKPKITRPQTADEFGQELIQKSLEKEIEQLRMEAKNLGIKNPHIDKMGKTRLLEEIEKAKSVAA